VLMVTLTFWMGSFAADHKGHFVLWLRMKRLAISMVESLSLRMADLIAHFQLLVDVLGHRLRGNGCHNVFVIKPLTFCNLYGCRSIRSYKGSFTDFEAIFFHRVCILMVHLEEESVLSGSR
jgi:hypothetical protein